MNNYLTFLLFLCLSCTVNAQEGLFKRISIPLQSMEDIKSIAQLGIAIDHAYVDGQKHLVHDFHITDIVKLEEAGVQFDVLVNDLQPFYAEQCTHDHSAVPMSLVQDCFSDGVSYVTPENFELGSMGGYYTLEEAMEEMDKMALAYPHLISPRVQVNDQTTHEGRYLYWMKISDNPDVDEDEPQVMFNSITHAREPMGLMQNIFFMWYVLENYETDPEIKNIVDNTEMYFLPIINPDGYNYNYIINPNGGGLWRKNRRVNDDGTYGVDLNRNFSFGWGVDDQGSSPDPVSQVYRGPSPASEPEIQILEDFCSMHEFQFALNYHCYGNLLIYPWGFSSEVTDEGDLFFLFSEALTAENNFLAGTAIETVGYLANGVADDWMYGDTMAKPPIYSMTPEVGPGAFGFWPPASSIIDLSKTTIRQNINLASLPLNFGVATTEYDELTADLENTISVSLKKYGLKDGIFELDLSVDSDQVTIINNQLNFDPATGEVQTGVFDYLFDADTELGTVVTFTMLIDNGSFEQEETFTVIYGDENLNPGDVIFTDEVTDGAYAEFGDWTSSPEAFYSAPVAMNDSPGASYESNSYNLLVTEPITIGDSVETATLNFYTRWEIENGYDYVQVQVADIDNNFIEGLCGIHTTEGVGGVQPLGEPVYQASSGDEWLFEEMDLSDYAGYTIRIRFLLESDGFVEGNGFLFDDLSLAVQQGDLTSSKSIALEQRRLLVSPNPTSDRLDLRLNGLAIGHFYLYDAAGTLLLDKKASGGSTSIDLSSLRAGLYLLKYTDRNGIDIFERIIKQ